MADNGNDNPQDPVYAVSGRITKSDGGGAAGARVRLT
jgi:hypothetical protein